MNVASASGVPPHTIDRHQPALHESSMVKSPCHIPTVASWLTDERSFSTRRAVHRLPPSTRPNSLNYGLQVHLQSHSNTASKCISKLARLHLPTSHHRGLEVHISKLAELWPPCVGPNSLDYGLEVRMIKASTCIYTLPWFLPPSASPNSLDHGHLVSLQPRSVTGSECIAEFTRSSFSRSPRIALQHSLQPIQIYSV